MKATPESLIAEALASFEAARTASDREETHGDLMFEGALCARLAYAMLAVERNETLREIADSLASIAKIADRLREELDAVRPEEFRA